MNREAALWSTQGDVEGLYVKCERDHEFPRGRIGGLGPYQFFKWRHGARTRESELGLASTHEHDCISQSSERRMTCMIEVNVGLGNGLSKVTRIASNVYPSSWTRGQARELVWSVWRLMDAHACWSLRLREVQTAITYRLEFPADTGSASTAPMALSSEALTWLQSAEFDLTPQETKS